MATATPRITSSYIPRATIQCVAHNSRPAIQPQFLTLAQHQIRHATTKKPINKKKSDAPVIKRRKNFNQFIIPDLAGMTQFYLVDAMRYLRAAEVGRGNLGPKYELFVRLRAMKSQAPVRGQLRLPHPVKSDVRICVIAKPDTPAAIAAVEAGASVVGEAALFDDIRAGKVEFDRCICHEDSFPALAKANLGRILGPRGLMPNAKQGTITKNPAATMRDMVGSAKYREKLGVIRMAIGQLGFSPEEVQNNIRTFIDRVKQDIAALSDVASKDIHEVVLSSTNGPGFSLNGKVRGEDSIALAD